MPQFIKKPIVIDAIQFTEINDRLHKELNEFTGAELEIRNCNNLLCLVIPTLEGERVASPSDWIIKGVAGECYPCKPDIFKRTYDPV